MWESVWGSVLECGEGEGRGVREGKGRCGGVKKCEGRCGRVYGVSVEGVEKCVGVWGR